MNDASLPAVAPPELQGDYAIRVLSVSKVYNIYRHQSDMLKEVLFRRTLHHDHWALTDISFEVAKGEVVGIIGPNGAGKSTLLKIISGTLAPSEGSVDVRGKLVALLELGTGFHPEYTGRENVLMGGLCLGMTREEINRKSDSIIAFSELQAVIDQPMKTYSSGMWSRLAFSTAISVEPDVLIIDEALAAGDSYFVGKCLRRIDQICKSGTTVLFVAHSSGLIQRLCDRAIHIDSGRIVDMGDVLDVTSRYENLVVERLSNALRKMAPQVPALPEPNAAADSPRAPGESIAVADAMVTKEATSAGERGWSLAGDVVSIEAIRILDENGAEARVFPRHGNLRVAIDLKVRREAASPAVYVKINRIDGIFVWSWFSQNNRFSPELDYYDLGNWEPGLVKIAVDLPRLMFGHGDYTVSVLVYPEKKLDEPIAQAYAVAENVLTFAVRWGYPLSMVVDHDVLIFRDGVAVSPRRGAAIRRRRTVTGRE